MTDNKQNEQDTEQAQLVVSESNLALLTKAEIDVQISTAKAFPRSITKFLRKVMSLSTISADVAESCFYALPRGNKFVEGPSVRLAEIVAASYGNLRTGARVVYMDDKKIVAQGVAHDLEENYYNSQEVERSILQHIWEQDPKDPSRRRKTGRMETMNEDMKVVTGRAACSIAFRNAVFKVVPSAILKDVEEQIKKVAKGTAETLVLRRDKRLEFLHNLGVKDAQICAVLDIKEVNDIDLDKLQVLQGLINALKEGVDINSVFPPESAKGKADGANADAEAKLKKSKATKSKTPQEELEEKLKEKGENKTDDKPA